MAISQKEIAQHLGVSQALVGMALNNHPRISEVTRERVCAAAQELGYDRNLHSGARQMAAKRHGIRMLNDVIAVCSNPGGLPVHQQPFDMDILNGIESEAEKCGIDILTCRLRKERLPRLLAKKEVDGIITLSSTIVPLRLLRQLDIPIVHLGSMMPAVHSLSAEHYQGMLSATSHLIALGHRHIAFIGHRVNKTPDNSVLADAAKERFRGFCSAMETARLPVEYVDHSLTEILPGDGAQAFKSLWEQSRHRFTAVVCYNDTLAIGVIKAAREIKLHVPRDLSVVGFDAVSDRYSFEPFITSIGYDRVLMGKRAVEILLQYRHGKPEGGENTPEFIREKLPVHFEEGATTAPPRKNSK